MVYRPSNSRKPNCVTDPPPASSAARASHALLQDLHAYIRRNWDRLTRADAGLLQVAIDPKVPRPDHRWPVYISRHESLTDVIHGLHAHGLPARDLARLDIRRLPDSGTPLTEHGLLYLPHPYVVPGGRFNEMYGWDSYFLQVGLLRDDRIALAKDLVDNFLYQIQHYGHIFNANRTYYLTRSQPPFLTQMVLGVYRRTGDREWLRQAVPRLERYYRYWTTGDHQTKTGLSRYYDLGDGPAPEVVASERDGEGRTHYDRATAYYRTHALKDDDVRPFFDHTTGELTARFYQGDRAMRESGFDPSHRFGPFNADTVSYAPVCLNTLLYVMETDMADILTVLGRMPEATAWQTHADQRRHQINALLWDERDGLYYDYNFTKDEVRRYPFVTTLYPLWAGIADAAQAKRVVENLHRFEQPGGLQTSTHESGSQWDAPFGWAPMQLIAVQGLRRYGYREEADRIAVKFLALVLKEFITHQTVMEKYDVVRRTSRVVLKDGYPENVADFGWTAAVFTELYAALPAEKQREVLRLDGDHTHASSKAGYIRP